LDAGPPAGFFDEGRLTATGSNIDFWYIGKEASWVNQFESGLLTQNNTGGVNSGVTEDNIGDGNKFGSISHGGGLVDFHFNSSLGAGDQIPDTLIWNNLADSPTQNGSGSGVIFGFLKSLTDWTVVSYATNVVVFGLDDRGAGPNDNHDDWVGIAYVTPLPGAIFLFAPALAGLAWMRRRKGGSQPEAAAA
jgi:hypothetical protein